MRLQRPKLNRTGPQPTFHVKGWNDTHVIGDVYLKGELVSENLNRPIERFMCEYGLSPA